MEPLWKSHAVVLVSDGSGIFQGETDQGLFWRIKRYQAVQEEQTRGAGSMRGATRQIAESGSLESEADTERLRHSQDRRQLRISGLREGPVERLTRHACFSRYSCHAPRAGYVAKGLGEEGHVARGLIDARLQVGGAVAGRFQIVGDVKTRGARRASSHRAPLFG